MKATDLMIGDWFVTKKAKEMPMRIISIDKFIYGKTADGIKIGPFFAEEVVPMPLTTEILLKNGFPSDDWIGSFPEDENYDVEIAIGEGNRITWSINFDEYTIKELKYVHELQHAMNLFGIEKEIVV